MALRFCSTHSHGMSPFYLVYKQEVHHICHPKDLDIVPVDLFATEKSEETVTNELLQLYEDMKT